MVSPLNGAWPIDTWPGVSISQRWADAAQRGLRGKQYGDGIDDVLGMGTLGGREDRSSSRHVGRWRSAVEEHRHTTKLIEELPQLGVVVDGVTAVDGRC